MFNNFNPYQNPTGYNHPSTATNNYGIPNQFNSGYQNNNNNVSSQNNNNVNWIQVNGYQGAKDVIVQPNQTSWLMNTNSQEFYVKSSDNMGVSTLNCYKFHKFDPNSEEIIKEDKLHDFVKKSEFDALKEKIDTFEKMFNSKITYSKSKKGDEQ